MFVAPTPLEQLYGSSNLVLNIFIYGEASMHSVAAAVVPSAMLKEQGPAGVEILLKVDDFSPLLPVFVSCPYFAST